MECDFSLWPNVLDFSQQDGAAKIAARLPRTRGFFQEMRNAIPQMIFAGEVDLSFEIMTSFKTPALSNQVIIYLNHLFSILATISRFETIKITDTNNS